VLYFVVLDLVGCFILYTLCVLGLHPLCSFIELTYKKKYINICVYTRTNVYVNEC
jgi:hypothetical protein